MSDKMLDHLKGKGTRGSRSKSRKKNSTDSKPKKRPPPQLSQSKDRASKVQKTDVESVITITKGARTEGRAPSEAIEIFDDDEDDEDSKPINSPFRHAQRPQSLISNGKVKNERPTRSPSVGLLPSTEKGDDAELKQCRADLDAQTARANGLDVEIALLKSNHAQELQNARLERQAEEAKSKKLLEDMERRISEMDADYRSKERDSISEKTRLSADLFNAKKERDELKTTLDSERKNLSTEQEVQADLHKQIEGLREQLEAAQQKTTDFDNLQDENTSLKAASIELAELKRVKHLTPSPTPPMCDEQLRIENVRKTYIRVKKRYDNLYSIARDVSTSTKGMNLSNFGEFGAYLRQLNAAMEDVDGFHEGAGPKAT